MNTTTLGNPVRSFSWLVIIVASITIGLDQVTKFAVLQSFLPGEIRPIVPGLFNLTLTFNPGAAFGLWSGLSEGVRELVLALTIMVALAVVVFFLKQPGYRNTPAQVALAAILGGAVGNVIDRFIHGSVVDFLDFYINSSHWPAFNVADSAICLGVGVLLLIPYLQGRS